MPPSSLHGGAAGGPRPLLAHIVGFSRALHAAGLSVSSASVIELCRSLDLIGITNRGDFRAAAMATLVSRQEEIERFDRVFREFWEGRMTDELVRRQGPEPEESEKGSKERRGASSPERTREAVAASGTQDGQEGERDIVGWSTEALVLQKDIGSLDPAELEQARAAVADLVRSLAAAPSLRYRAAGKGTRLDFRRMFRRNVPYDAQPMTLLYRQRRERRTRLVLLCDVSGSMERYSRFLIQFMYGLRRELPLMQIGVFATRLTMITDLLGRLDPEISLQRVSREVSDWGSGTDIGGSLRDFNERHARRIAGSRTTLLILSDGWDRGDPEVMRREIELLHRRVHRLVWLNPLLGSKDYLPLCRGIRTALPFMDDFLPAHNLASLRELVLRLRASHH